MSYASATYLSLQEATEARAIDLPNYVTEAMSELVADRKADVGEETYTDKIRRYIEIKAEMDRLKDQLDLLKDDVIYAVTDEDGQCIKMMGCEITVQQRKSWEYSETVRQETEALKALKKAEEARGIAVLKSVSSFPVINAARD